jgi:hypothetical protein
MRDFSSAIGLERQPQKRWRRVVLARRHSVAVESSPNNTAGCLPLPPLVEQPPGCSSASLMRRRLRSRNSAESLPDAEVMRQSDEVVELEGHSYLAQPAPHDTSSAAASSKTSANARPCPCPAQRQTDGRHPQASTTPPRQMHWPALRQGVAALRSCDSPIQNDPDRRRPRQAPFVGERKTSPQRVLTPVGDSGAVHLDVGAKPETSSEQVGKAGAHPWFSSVGQLEERAAAPRPADAVPRLQGAFALEDRLPARDGGWSVDSQQPGGHPVHTC